MRMPKDCCPQALNALLAYGEKEGTKMAKRTTWAEKTWHKGKLNSPMNHMLDVASY